MGLEISLLCKPAVRSDGMAQECFNFNGIFDACAAQQVVGKARDSSKHNIVTY